MTVKTADAGVSATKQAQEVDSGGAVEQAALACVGYMAGVGALPPATRCHIVHCGLASHLSLIHI